MATKSDKLREKNNSYSDILRIEQLQALEQIIAISGGGGGGLAQESTLLSILNNMIASQDVEILLVRDTGAANVVVQQIREYDQGTGAWVTRYEDVSGGAYVPVGPLEYLDASAVLNLVLAELQGLNTPQSIGATYDVVTDATGSPIAAGKRRVSVFNSGSANGSWMGKTIKPGVVLSFVADERDTLPSFAYDGTGTELLITTVG
jgi:hypothetical protein